MVGKVKYFNRIKYHKKILFLVLFLTFTVNAYSQASWDGSLWFTLKDSSGQIITPNDIINGNVRFYYNRNMEQGFITYDSDNQCFIYRTHGPSTIRFLKVVSGDRGVEIFFPIPNGGSVTYITDPIEINDLTYEFRRENINNVRGRLWNWQLDSESARISTMTDFNSRWMRLELAEFRK
jgi:hypothetical protein